MTNLEKAKEIFAKHYYPDEEKCLKLVVVNKCTPKKEGEKYTTKYKCYMPTKNAYKEFVYDGYSGSMSTISGPLYDFLHKKGLIKEPQSFYQTSTHTKSFTCMHYEFISEYNAIMIGRVCLDCSRPNLLENTPRRWEWEKELDVFIVFAWDTTPYIIQGKFLTEENAKSGNFSRVLEENISTAPNMEGKYYNRYIPDKIKGLSSFTCKNWKGNQEEQTKFVKALNPANTITWQEDFVHYYKNMVPRNYKTDSVKSKILSVPLKTIEQIIKEEEFINPDAQEGWYYEKIDDNWFVLRHIYFFLGEFPRESERCYVSKNLVFGAMVVGDSVTTHSQGTHKLGKFYKNNFNEMLKHPVVTHKKALKELYDYLSKEVNTIYMGSHIISFIEHMIKHKYVMEFFDLFPLEKIRDIECEVEDWSRRWAGGAPKNNRATTIEKAYGFKKEQLKYVIDKEYFQFDSCNQFRKGIMEWLICFFGEEEILIIPDDIFHKVADYIYDIYKVYRACRIEKWSSIYKVYDILSVSSEPNKDVILNNAIAYSTLSEEDKKWYCQVYVNSFFYHHYIVKGAFTSCIRWKDDEKRKNAVYDHRKNYMANSIPSQKEPHLQTSITKLENLLVNNYLSYIEAIKVLWENGYNVEIVIMPEIREFLIKQGVSVDGRTYLNIPKGGGNSVLKTKSSNSLWD